VWAPKGTPDDRIQALNKVANEAVTQLVRAGAFEQLGIEPVKETVEEFRKFSGAYVTESADLLRGAGFKPE
jgi:tripartite-type tricarboxylate transporter receptor subunit TctC